MDISDIVVDDNTVVRYRQNYDLGPEIKAYHVEKHLKLEFELHNGYSPDSLLERDEFELPVPRLTG